MYYTLVLSLGFLAVASAACFDPSPAFPVPSWDGDAALFLDVPFTWMERTIADIVADSRYDTTSFSIEVTSQTKTLWSFHHSARKHNETRPGTIRVNDSSQYRIASITKTFTVLGLLYQHAAGNLSIDDTVDQYVPELAGPDSGSIPWHDITLRALASQLSGIPRESVQSDTLTELEDPTAVGLPPANANGLPDCYQYNDMKPCTRTQLLDYFRKKSPVFAPDQQSSYSNIGFELLGMVLENVTGLSYNQYMEEAIFKPLNLSSTTLETPDDKNAVLPVGQYFWTVDEGAHSPAGGIYSTSADLSSYLRYILTHYNALVTGVNWLLPASWGGGMQNTYGMPWEIFRSDAMLWDNKRSVTFVTKAGGVPMYTSRITLMPEYGLGLTILVGGAEDLFNKLQDVVATNLAQAAETVVWRELALTHAATYNAIDKNLNSTITLSVSESKGLILNNFISNSTDVFQTLIPAWAGAMTNKPWHAHLVPTLLFRNETTQQGEIWRLLVVPERTKEDSIWDSMCHTDVDPASYAGLPVNEVVFWHEEGEIELPAWKVRMRREYPVRRPPALSVQSGSA